MAKVSSSAQPRESSSSSSRRSRGSSSSSSSRRNHRDRDESPGGREVGRSRRHSSSSHRSSRSSGSSSRRRHRSSRSGHRSSRRRSHRHEYEYSDNEGSDDEDKQDKLHMDIVKKVRAKADRDKSRSHGKRTLLGGFTDDNNPFGDRELSVPFVWEKKVVSDVLSGRKVTSSVHNQSEAQREIAGLELRRKQRIEEQEARDRERIEATRAEREEEEKGRRENEDQFYVRQSYKRALIHVTENRALPLDRIMYYANSPIAELTTTTPPPLAMFNHMTVEELDGVANKLRYFGTHDVLERRTLWGTLGALVRAEKAIKSTETRVPDEVIEQMRDQMAAEDTEMVAKLLKESIEELESASEGRDYLGLRKSYLEREDAIRRMDVEHMKVLERRQSRLESLSGVQLDQALAVERDTLSLKRKQMTSRSWKPDAQAMAKAAGIMSTERGSLSSAAQKLVAEDMAEGVGSDEAVFGGEVEAGEGETIPDFSHLPESQRPRKPTFVNRVRTGFSWTKYNRAHYDRENPPPQMVLGYKFHVMYPDLIDTRKVPSFTVTPTKDPNVAILRFSASAPYQDIAFRIVNRPWNNHPRFGFKTRFERGVFSLHFSFKRTWYIR